MKEVFKRKYRALHGAAKMWRLLLVIMIIPAMAAGCGKRSRDWSQTQPLSERRGGFSCSFSLELYCIRRL